VNLALLIGRFPPNVHGGAELQAEQWALRLSARHRVTVVTRAEHGAGASRETRDGFVVERLPVGRLPFVRALQDRERILRAIAAFAPRPDLLLCFQTFISGWAGVRVQQRLGVPAVVWVRGEDEIRMRSARTRWTSVGVWTHARGVLVQGAGMRDSLLAELAPPRAAHIAPRLAIVPNGIELPAPAPPRPRSGVLAVGRLVERKGMDVLIEAAVGLAQPLTVAGAGPERERLEALAHARGVDVRFTGALERAALQPLYAAAAACVLPSRFGEGFPNVVLEAQAHGCPVVATRVTGVGDLIEHERNGLLVAPGDPVALRAAIARVMGDPELAMRLGCAGRATAEGHAWERVLPQLEDQLERWRVA